jgi:hypothetical protein
VDGDRERGRPQHDSRERSISLPAGIPPHDDCCHDFFTVVNRLGCFARLDPWLGCAALAGGKRLIHQE